MNFYTLSSLLASVTLLAMGIFMFIMGKPRLEIRIWTYICFGVVFWQIGSFGFSTATSKEMSFYWWQFAHIGAMLVPPIFFHFICIYLKINRKLLIIFAYVFTAVFIVINFCFGRYFIGDLRITPDHFYWIDWFHYRNPLFIAYYAIIYGLLLGYSYIILINAFRQSIGIRRKQFQYLIIGTAVAWSGPMGIIISYFGINLYTYTNILMGTFPIIMGYAIVRHQLMDIELIIKKTLVFAGLFAAALAIFVLPTLIIQEFVISHMGLGGRVASLGISSLLIILILEPLKNFLIRITDKYLFQKKYDYRHLIREFMDELKTMILNTNDIAQSTVDFLNTSIRPTSSAIFMYNKFTSQYDLISSSDFKDKSFKIPDNSKLIKMLGETGAILNITNSDKLLLPQEKDQFSKLGIDLIIPLLIHKELIGFLCLGKKKSDEDYGEDDIEALSGLSGALSISLNNAQLFDERADAEKRALVGTIATGINHEIGNPLNIITIKLDTFRILAKEGLLAHKTKEEIIDEVDKITKVCLDSAQRIAEITKQVSEFAKPDKKLIFDKVNISEAIDETMAFLKHGMIIDIEKIEKIIMCEPVYVLADRGQLKQVLFNLIKNASHAIDKEKGKIIVTVDKNNSGEIAIKIADNGHGMTKEVMDKVFTPFFTTKEPGKGTGLGLALVKIMIDRNNARIKVESEEEEGTTFTLIFKGGLL